ncbi:hypothetical protein SAMN05421790_103288 [Kroppenstedtia eburnea]|uniref:Uncharacterized protein n=1 Tax=Kroppenstedtia eburnea TaxID=714067 RepID=A0A1N7KV53_9BACL|nr:hypothetical protein SAMN05421790_103288 [Kroppenstedtia eburnea]
MRFGKVVFFSLSAAFLFSLLSLGTVTPSDLPVSKYNSDQPG